MGLSVSIRARKWIVKKVFKKSTYCNSQKRKRHTKILDFESK